MLNKIGKKRNQGYRYSCTEKWCPCNDGKMGCFAEENIMHLCDFSELLPVLNDCYDAMLESDRSGDKSIYEDACERFFKYVDYFGKDCPAFYRGYCSEKEDGCFSPNTCKIRIKLLEEGR